MKLNVDVRYGLRAILEIAKSEKPVLQKEIAEHQDISLHYLDYIIASLKKAGLIVNFRGKGSGYTLAKKPMDITVYDIYKAFSPDLQLVHCSCETNECQRLNTCQTKDYWFELNSHIKDFMKMKTIDNLLNDSLLVKIHSDKSFIIV